MSEESRSAKKGRPLEILCPTEGAAAAEEPAIDVGSPLVFPTTASEGGRRSPEADDEVTEETIGGDSISAEAGDENNGQDGASAENDDSGATRHLVEGDFFPEASASVLEEIENQAEDEEEEATGTQDTATQAALKRARTEATTAAAKSLPSSPSVPLAPPPPTPPRPTRPVLQKRVSWADHLIQRVATFYLPSSHPAHAASPTGAMQTDPASPTHTAPAVSPAPASIFTEKTNTDGNTYKCCKAQRPSQRFMDWKRQMQQQPQITPATAAHSPFTPQPHDSEDAGTEAEESPSQPTLFAQLYRRGGSNVLGGVAVSGWRRQDLHGRVRPALPAPWATRCPQLPYIDPAARHDEPLLLPL